MMEIDFMILWKKNVSEKTNLQKSVLEMLEMVFPNTNLEELFFKESHNITHILPYKISNNSTDIVYLKIECNYSDAKAAKTLSLVRDKLCLGKHKAKFSIICSYDDASLSFCCRLMKPFGVFERRLREIMYLSTVKLFGYDWVAKTFPPELINKIKEKTNGISDEKLTEKAFEFLDYSEITSYLFCKRRKNPNLNEILDIKLSDDNLKLLSEEEIINIIQETRYTSLWDMLFSDNIELKLLAKKVDSFRRYRNDTMHHHTMDIKTFKKIQSELNKANRELKIAVLDMEHKIYTQEVVESVISVLGMMIAQIVEGMSEIVLTLMEDIGKTTFEIIKNLVTNLPNFKTPDLKSIAYALSDVNNTTDLSLPTYNISSGLNVVNSSTSIAKLPSIKE